MPHRINAGFDLAQHYEIKKISVFAAAIVTQYKITKVQ
jgi:hypothetical protein